MNSNLSFLGLPLLFLVGFFAMSSAYIVDETQQAVITQFGKPIGKVVKKPGIYFKIPVMQTANYFEKRFLEWDGNPNQVPTKDKKFIWVDTYARWQISDALLFFQRLRDERGAQSRLDDILDGEVRNAIANSLLVEIIRTSAQIQGKEENQKDKDDGNKEMFQTIKDGRDQITRNIIIEANKRTKDLGIEILDMKFKRINYVEEVRKKVYERMISERQRIADKYRSEGQGEASKILGKKDVELKKITSEAFRQAEEIRGKADAEAAGIYAQSYDKNTKSRSFYRFLKTMDTYKKTLDAKTSLFLSTDSEVFKDLKSSSD